MDWIKRNLYFLIGSLVALALMGLAGWYLYSKWELNNSRLADLNEQYAKLKELSKQNPHPGSGTVDNIKAAREQQKQLRAWIQKVCEHFQRIPPIPLPESGKVTEREFSDALNGTIDQLQRQATNANVTLPPKNSTTGQTYSFSFEQQRPKLSFAPGSLEPLSVQLGEVKAICDVLLRAKINALDAVRRERVSEDDQKGPQTDYIPEKTVTNEANRARRAAASAKKAAAAATPQFAVESEAVEETAVEPAVESVEQIEAEDAGIADAQSAEEQAESDEA